MTYPLPKQFFPLILIFSIILISTAHAKPKKITCSPTPRDGTRHFTYETIWEQPAEAENFLLAHMVDASYDSQGNICIVDFSQKNLLILDPDGIWLRTLGREGEGPGEIRDARKVFFDGNKYGLLQGYPAAIVWLNSDGSPAGKVNIGSNDPDNLIFTAVAHAEQEGSQIYAWVNQTHYSESGENEEEVKIITLGSDGSLGAVLYHRPDEESAREGDGINEGKVYDIWFRRWTGDGNGGVWVAPQRDQYVIQHWNQEGILDLEISRDYKPIIRNQISIQSNIDWFTRRGWDKDKIKVGKTAPIVRSLRIGDNGNLWVKLDQGGKDKESDLAGVYDVFSPTGEYLQQVRFHSDVNLDSLKMLDDMTALVMTTDPDDDEAFLSFQKARESTPDH